MSRTVTIEKTVCTFGELSPKAKDEARAWWREASQRDEWWESTFEDAKQCAAILGIEIAPLNQRCIGGYTGGKWDANKVTIDNSPAITFSGFWSQGDGASFDGSYEYAPFARRKIRQHAPQDETLYHIADDLTRLQVKHKGRLTASMKHSGHYAHSGYMGVTVDDNETVADGWLAIESEVTRIMRSFANWIYKQLESEYEYRNADAQVDDAIIANEYEFTADGKRYSDAA